MKFLVDAHLPPSLCKLLAQHGHDAIHTLDLPAKNATKDNVLNQLSVDEERVVISKDSDFFYSHIVLNRPWKLVLVKTGNISTGELCALFERHFSDLDNALGQYSLVEIDQVTVRPLV
jgi:predicted nuclease of predicted toxin-antitoxin system